MIEQIGSSFHISRGNSGTIVITGEFVPGDRVEFRVKRHFSQAEPSIDIIVPVTVAAGEVLIEIKPEDTADLAPGGYAYQAHLFPAQGGVHSTPLGGGVFNILGVI